MGNPFTRVEGAMCYKSCQSGNLREFAGEICIHLPGIKNVDKPHVMVFPTLVVCLNCGLAEFSIPHHELQLLANTVIA